MPLNQNTLDEIKLLCRFNLNTMQEGLKIHSSADESVNAAAQRLFDKNLTSQPDGGYLTDLGRKAAEHAQLLKQILQE